MKTIFGMDYGTSLLLTAGVIIASWFFYNKMGGFEGVFGSKKANYAYPNFYPYGHPFYYMHMDAPEVRNNYGVGRVDVPRISNALAAKEVITGNKQYSHSNPMYDSNHIYSYIQEEY